MADEKERPARFSVYHAGLGIEPVTVVGSTVSLDATNISVCLSIPAMGRAAP
jgi:hypothetical protein